MIKRKIKPIVILILFLVSVVAFATSAFVYTNGVCATVSESKTISDFIEFDKSKGLDFDGTSYNSASNAYSLGKYTSDDDFNYSFVFKFNASNYKKSAIYIKLSTGYALKLNIAANGRCGLYYLNPSSESETTQIKTTDDENFSNILKSYNEGDPVTCTISVVDGELKFSLSYGGNTQSATTTVNLKPSNMSFWYESQNGNVLTLYDAFYRVSVDDGRGNVTQVKVEYGQKLDLDSLPTCGDYVDGENEYEFRGWFVGDAKYDFDSAVVKNFTISAVYEDKSVADEPEFCLTVTDKSGVALATTSSLDGVDSVVKSKVETDENRFIGYSYGGNLYPDLNSISFCDESFPTVVAETITLYVSPGASVRAVEPYGIRFTAISDGSTYDYGMILSTEPIISSLSDFTIVDLEGKSAKYEMISASTGMKQVEKDGVHIYAIALVDIKKSNYNLGFGARAFAKVTYYDSSERVIYSAFSIENNCRSPYDVALKAVESNPQNAESDVLRAYLDGVVDLKIENGEAIILRTPYAYSIDVNLDGDKLTLVLTSASGNFDVSSVVSVSIDGERVEGIENVDGKIVLDVKNRPFLENFILTRDYACF